MTQLEKLMAFVRSFPRWEEQPLQVDTTGAAPVNAGIFPLGEEILERREDVLGHVRIYCRSRYQLLRCCDRGNGQADAQWLQDFQQWVRQCSATGTAPAFGDDPAQEKLRAEKGALRAPEQADSTVYAVTITAEYVKDY